MFLHIPDVQKMFHLVISCMNIGNHLFWFSSFPCLISQRVQKNSALFHCSWRSEQDEQGPPFCRLNGPGLMLFVFPYLLAVFPLFFFMFVFLQQQSQVVGWNCWMTVAGLTFASRADQFWGTVCSYNLLSIVFLCVSDGRLVLFTSGYFWHGPKLDGLAMFFFHCFFSQKMSLIVSSFSMCFPCKCHDSFPNWPHFNQCVPAPLPRSSFVCSCCNTSSPVDGTGRELLGVKLLPATTWKSWPLAGKNPWVTAFFMLCYIFSFLLGWFSSQKTRSPSGFCRRTRRKKLDLVSWKKFGTWLLLDSIRWSVLPHVDSVLCVFVPL